MKKIVVRARVEPLRNVNKRGSNHSIVKPQESDPAAFLFSSFPAALAASSHAANVTVQKKVGTLGNGDDR